MNDAPGSRPPVSPDWFLAGFDADHGRFQFAPVSRDTYRDSAFLDHRIRPRPDRVRSFTADEVDRALSARPPGAAAWIFHTAFCCSTLLATCLQHETKTLVLREPAVLSQLAARMRQHRQAVDADLTRRVVLLTERAYAGEQVVIKPSNYANALAGHVLGTGAVEHRKVVLLSCSLVSLLVSVLKKREEAERVLGSFTTALLEDSDYRGQVPLPPLESLTLLQQAVVFWHCQRHHFARLMQGAPEDQVLGLSMERFLAQPQTELEAVSAHFGLGLDEAEIRSVTETGAMRRDAKAGSMYGPERRRLESKAVATRHADELRSALDWAQARLDALPVRPLVSGEDVVSG